ncbi:MAG TPA: O-antigen ligase family protein [Burkholderiales bacterium]|nr:O-antigen ligase family protein [Burkholderiales bacterium]
MPTTGLLLVLPVDHTTALRMIFLVLTALAALAFSKTRGLQEFPLLLPFAICFAVALASVVSAENPGFSFDEVKKELGYGLIVFLAFFSLARSPRDIAAWLLALLVGLLWLGFYALVQGWYVGTLAFDGWHGGVLNYTVFVCTVFPLLYLGLFHPVVPVRLKALAALAMPLSLYTTFLSVNRISWVTIATSIAVCALLVQGTRGTRRVKWSSAILACVLLGVCAGALSMAAKTRVAPQGNLEETVTLTMNQDPRMRLWAYSVQRIKDSPWMGTGFGRMAQAHAFARQFDNEAWLVHSHNLFLDYGIQMGIPGILAFAGLFIAILAQFWKLYRSSDFGISLIGIAGLAIVVAVLLKSATDNQFIRHNALLFWALVGMGLGYGARLARAHREAGAPPAG